MDKDCTHQAMIFSHPHRIGPPLPPPRTSGRIVVELEPARVGMFRFLLEAYENVAYFTVLDKQIARLAVIFSPHRERATRHVLEEIGQSLHIRIVSIYQSAVSLPPEALTPHRHIEGKPKSDSPT